MERRRFSPFGMIDLECQEDIIRISIARRKKAKVAGMRLLS